MRERPSPDGGVVDLKRGLVVGDGQISDVEQLRPDREKKR